MSKILVGIGCVVAAVAGGCGYLDRDLSLSKEAFERSFQTERVREALQGGGEGVSERIVGGHRHGSRRITLGCGLRIYGRGHLSLRRRAKLEIYYDRFCRRARGPLCQMVGSRLRGGLSRRLDFARLRARLAARCRVGEGRACAQAAVLWRQGLGGGADESRARAWVERACEEGVEEMCQDDEGAS